MHIDIIFLAHMASVASIAVQIILNVMTLYIYFEFKKAIKESNKSR